MGALKMPKSHFFSKIQKNQKEGPFYVKKIFDPEFAQSTCVQFLDRKDAIF